MKRLLFGLLWRLYQCYLILAGMMLFYWIFGIYTDKDGGDYIGWWMLAAFVFGLFFAWLGTLLTVRGLDLLKRTLRNKTPESDSQGPSREAAGLERLHRLGVSEKPDDFITLRPTGRKHLP